MRNTAILTALIAFCGFADLRGEEVDASSAVKGALGDHVRFVDTITEVVVKESGTVFLNFGKHFPHEILTAIILVETRTRFPEAHLWAGRQVRVEGRLAEKNGRKRIILREPAQLALAE